MEVCQIPEENEPLTESFVILVKNNKLQTTKNHTTYTRNQALSGDVFLGQKESSVEQILLEAICVYCVFMKLLLVVVFRERNAVCTRVQKGKHWGSHFMEYCIEIPSTGIDQCLTFSKAALTTVDGPLQRQATSIPV